MRPVLLALNEMCPRSETSIRKSCSSSAMMPASTARGRYSRLD